MGKLEDAISSVRVSGEKFLQVIPVPEIALPRRRGEFAIWKVREWSETGRECRPGWIRDSEKDEDPPLGVPVDRLHDGVVKIVYYWNSEASFEELHDGVGAYETGTTVTRIFWEDETILDLLLSRAHSFFN